MDHYSYQDSDTSNNFYQPTVTRNTNQLWVDSEITGRCVSPYISFSHQKRFKWASIYWPQGNDRLVAMKNKRKSEIQETAEKISKMIDEEEKNQARIKQIKRSFSIGRSTHASTKKDTGAILSTRKPFKLSKQNEEVLERLSPRDRKQSLLRDRHGNRCNLYEDPQVDTNQKDLNYLGNSTGFKTSRKFKLELPHNYYPGPGTYEIKRYLAQLDKKDSRRPKTSRVSVAQRN